MHVTIKWVLSVPWDYVYMETRALNIACTGKYRSVVVPAFHGGLTKWPFASEYLEWIICLWYDHGTPSVYQMPLRSCGFAASCLGTFDWLQDNGVVLHTGGFSSVGGQAPSSKDLCTLHYMWQKITPSNVAVWRLRLSSCSLWHRYLFALVRRCQRYANTITTVVRPCSYRSLRLS